MISFLLMNEMCSVNGLVNMTDGFYGNAMLQRMIRAVYSAWQAAKLVKPLKVMELPGIRPQSVAKSSTASAIAANACWEGRDGGADLLSAI